MKLRHIAIVLVLLLIGGLVWFCSGQNPIWSKHFQGPEFPKEVRDRADFKGAPEKVRRFIRLDSLQTNTYKDSLAQIEKDWQPGFRYQLLEMFRSLPPNRREEVAALLAKKTDQNFGADLTNWQTWSWNEDYAPTDDYAQFKHYFYRRIDPWFGTHFVDTDNAKIRLDEIQWGGVMRDGIPPLKNPKMIEAEDADYLEDFHVVFGIKLNGEAKCYPKRILAWHEMFKDSIGGESVAGVY